MVTSRRIRFVHAQTAWMFASLLALTLLSAFSLDLFLVVALIVFLVVV